MNGAARASRNGSRPELQPPAAHCPRCGERYGASGFVQEYWTSERRVFSCWCSACHFVCDVVVVDRVISFEPPHYW